MALIVKDRVKRLLISNPELRQNDCLLVWEVLKEINRVKRVGNDEVIFKADFVGTPIWESVVRARREIQRAEPELGKQW